MIWKFHFSHACSTLSTSIFLCLLPQSEQIRRVGNAKLRAGTHARSAGLLGPWLLIPKLHRSLFAFWVQVSLHMKQHRQPRRKVWKKCALTPSSGCGQERRVATTALSSAPGVFKPKYRRGMWEWGESVFICRHLSFQCFSCCQTGLNQVLYEQSRAEVLVLTRVLSQYGGFLSVRKKGN